jgi:hypothetical protein
VRTLTTLASSHKVELISIAPSAPSPVHVAGQQTAVAPPAASNSPGTATTTTPAAPAANLTAIQVSINVVGEYYDIQQFLSSLEDTTRATIVSSVDLQPGQLPQPQGGPGSGSAANSTGSKWTTLSATITASVFMSATPASSATPVAPAAPAAANGANK